jgi:DNA-binding LacI/PurR family transcriptional regulator
MFTNPWFSLFSAGIAGVAEQQGYGLHFISPLHGSLSRAIHRATVDGVVAIGLTDDHPEIDEIRRARLPIVLVDSNGSDDAVTVDVDDEAGARLAARHVVELGHRRVAILAFDGPASTRQDDRGVVARRLRGYRTELMAAGIDVPAESVATGTASIDGGQAAFERLWTAGSRPTAVLAMSDAMAIGAIRGIHALGLAVPGDLSVVGFDDIDLVASTDPPLTTVHQPVRRKGEAAIELLLSMVAGRNPPPGRRRLETELVVRSSTGAPPAPSPSLPGRAPRDS